MGSGSYYAKSIKRFAYEKIDGGSDMYKIEIEIEEMEDIRELMQMEEENDEIDIITEKNFTGDITKIEVFIGALEILIPLVRSLIKNKKVSSMKLDGEKIELKNVSEELLQAKFKTIRRNSGNCKRL